MSLGKQLSEARRSLKLTTSEVAAATRVKVQIIEGLEDDDFSKIAAPIYGKGFIRLYAEHVRIDPNPLVAEYMRAVGAPDSPPLDLGAESSPAPQEEVAAPVQTSLNRSPEPEPEITETEYDLFNAPHEVSDEPENPAQEDEPPETSQDDEKPADISREPELVELPGEEEEEEEAPGRDRQVAAMGGARAAAAQITAWIAAAGTGAWQRARAVKLDRDPWKLIPVALGLVLIIAFIVSGLSRCARDPGLQTAGIDPAEKENLRIAVDLPEPYFE
jgi:hypothetical protein